MKLLICTQAYDPADPILGFFARWVEELAQHCEQVTVICLRTAEFERPANVRVFPLRGSRIARAYKLLRGAWKFSRNYDTVLVHMNPEYVLVAGLLWRLMGKRVAMWYAHGGVNLKLRAATLMVQRILTSSPEGFRVKTRKVRVLGQGIDTDFFSPGEGARGREVLSVGRLSKAKRHDLVIASAQFHPHEVWIAGDGPERQTLEALAKERGVSARVQFLGARTQAELRELYRRAGVFAHFSETGSMDKVLLEAILCGMPVVSSSEAYRSLLEPHGLFLGDKEPRAIAAALERALGTDMAALIAEVKEKHSLQRLIPAILKAL